MGDEATRKAVLEDLRSLDPKIFVAKYFFDRVPFAFGADRDRFINWKTALARGVGVDPADIAVVGSAAIGVSLNPYKAFKLYNSATSDIDVAIISAFYFQAAWRHLRQNNSKRHKLPPREKSAWEEHTTRLVYWGAIATDRLLLRFPFGPEWRTKINVIEQEFGTGQAINVRLYNDFEALRTYQVVGVRERQQAVLTAGS